MTKIRLIPAHAGKTLVFLSVDTACRAHPRSRGENDSSPSSPLAAGGSSPLTRGKPCPASHRGPGLRLIPAHAGKTLAMHMFDTGCAAHPRSRGENGVEAGHEGEPFGSSPLTRGKPNLPKSQKRPYRLIPAHAGKTGQKTRRVKPASAHPRSRGENAHRVATHRAACGSSPLTRGKPHACVRHPRAYRLIPAHAGKTVGVAYAYDRGAAHPRSRGENTACVERKQEHWGSSPLTRGKPHCEPGRNRTCRLIPAHAGKTTIRKLLSTENRAHPRSRGENVGMRARRPAARGSSPLTRGKLAGQYRHPCRLRLIPAHAGKTDPQSNRGARSAAHPRSRGENTSRPALLLRRSIRSWKPLSLPSPLEVTQFGSLAQLTRRRIRFGVLASSFRVVGAHHECESIEVNGLPWVSPRQEGESLLVARPVDHDGTSGLHVLSDDVPQALAYTGAERPHEDPRGNLHEPPRHVTSQPLGHRGQDQDDHQESLSS